MSECLNSQETSTINMVEIDVSKDVTILENTVLRLAGELGIPLKETNYSGISYKKDIAGRNENIEINYYHDFDDYEAFTAEKGDSKIRISNIEGEYRWNLGSSGEKLLEKAYQRTKNPIEKKMNLQILLLKLQNKITSGEIYDRLIVTLKESEMNLITAKTILKYLS